jgi:hypothetical protein
MGDSKVCFSLRFGETVFPDTRRAAPLQPPRVPLSQNLQAQSSSDLHLVFVYSTAMEAVDNALAAVGVHFEQTSPIAKAAVAILLSVGAFTLFRPFLSLFRLLSSLFILPGQSVSSRQYQKAEFRVVANLDHLSSANSVLLALGLLLPAPPMALARNLL